MEYGVVPDSTTQTDQLKISGDLNDDNKLYALPVRRQHAQESPIGHCRPRPGTVYARPGPFVPPASDERVSNRQFNGADVRWTNTTIENVSITTYGRSDGGKQRSQRRS